MLVLWFIKLLGNAAMNKQSCYGVNYFIPVYFEISNQGQFIDGSFLEIYIKTNKIPHQIVIPKSAIIEEQGKHFVYVQTHGESFEKRKIEINGFDGENYSIQEGINPNERIVTKGVYYITVSSKSSTLPLHGHTH